MKREKGPYVLPIADLWLRSFSSWSLPSHKATYHFLISQDQGGKKKRITGDGLIAMGID